MVDRVDRDHGAARQPPAARRQRIGRERDVRVFADHAVDRREGEERLRPPLPRVAVGVALDRLGGQIARAPAFVETSSQAPRPAPPSRALPRRASRTVRLRARLAAQLRPVHGDDGRRALARRAADRAAAGVQQDERRATSVADHDDRRRGERPDVPRADGGAAGGGSRRSSRRADEGAGLPLEGFRQRLGARDEDFMAAGLDEPDRRVDLGPHAARRELSLGQQPRAVGDVDLGSSVCVGLPKSSRPARRPSGR